MLAFWSGWRYSACFPFLGRSEFLIHILGLFTVNIFRPFSAHFQSHFSIIFMNLAEKLTEWTEKCDKK
jgi:hypothetical protein